MMARDATETGVTIETGRHGQHPHLTITVFPQGLGIQANVELQESHKRFRRAQKFDPAAFLELLRQLGNVGGCGADDSRWRFRVSRRVSLGRPRAYHYYSAVDVATAVMMDWSDMEMQCFIDEVTKTPVGEACPQIFIMRHYAVTEVLARESMIDELSEDVSRLEPFFHWIGQPFR